MFFDNGKHRIIILFCLFWGFFQSKKINGIFLKSNDTLLYDERYYENKKNRNKKLWKLIRSENRKKCATNPIEISNKCLFLKNYIQHTNYFYRKNVAVFKKDKRKDKQSGVIKKKEKRKFTEEEIEELRKKAKEKEQAKEKGKTKIKLTPVIGRKKKRDLKEKKKAEEEKKKESEEELKEKEKDLKETELKDKEENYIKTREDFDKIVELTNETINPKEVEYIQKISDCDEELLNYDKREKHIELNFEDTLFDEGNYMDNYVNNISKFRFDIYNINNKNEFDRITKYLNYQYIERIDVDIPQDKSYNIKLKQYFYEVVCTLIDRFKEKFEREKIQFMKEPTEEVKEKNREQNNTVLYQKGSLKYETEKTDNSPIISNFINETQKMQQKSLSTLHRINDQEEIHSLLKQQQQQQQQQQQKNIKDVTEKYMTADLFNLLCDIKEEYNYMFENGGLKYFSFDENRKKNKEKLLFTGKKKRAFATVFLQPGNNNLIINNRDGYQYMQYQIFSINKIFSPLLHLCMHRYFNVVADVKGGGISGQSVAIFHALVKYIVYNLSLKIKPFFRSFQFMTVDSRKVERKKFGYRKARKKKQYSKR